MAAAAILNFSHGAFFDIIDMFSIKFTTFPPSLVRVGPMVKKLEQFIESHDGGISSVYCGYFDMTDTFYIIPIL